MVQWTNLFTSSRHKAHDEVNHLLPTQADAPPPIPPLEVTKIALRLKFQLEQVVPCEIEPEKITSPLSTVITSKVISTAKSAGGEEAKQCVVFSLLICKKWFRRQALLEPWDADLHAVRATAAEIIAKRIIEDEDDITYLQQHVLLQRFSILVDGEPTHAANVIEKAVDLHALSVIGSSGYQRCVNYLWRGWLVQDDQDPTQFVAYDEKLNRGYWAHLDPDRMRVPRYQNAIQVLMSLIYLALYTGAINTINPTGDLDAVEIVLYLFTLAFTLDEAAKLWKVGRFYLSFWNVFNCTLYALLTTSFILRCVALAHPKSDASPRSQLYGQDMQVMAPIPPDVPPREYFNHMSYNFLAFTAPMFWLRLTLYLDSFRFFGAMLVVVKIMMRESLIFFALLLFVLVGFFQAFIGMDLVDEQLDASNFIVTAMANAVMSSPDFDGFDAFAPPFGLTLYYIFSFVVMVILLNILIALFGSAYSDITDNALDEYMALFASKTLQFVRAPDENVFIPPFNLIELFGLSLTCEWWMSRERYAKLNDFVMGLLYAPLLFITAGLETRDAWIVRDNRRRGDVDEDTVEEWEQLAVNGCNGAASATHTDETQNGATWKVEQNDEVWMEKVKSSTTDVRADPVLKEVKELKQQIEELKKLLAGIHKQ